MDNLTLLAINRIPSLRNTEKHHISQIAPTLNDIKRLSISQLHTITQRTLKLESLDMNQLVNEAQQELDLLTLKRIKIFTFNSFPSPLQIIDNPPFLLFGRTNHHTLPNRNAIAVVGTRKPSKEGAHEANRLGAFIAQHNHILISGLANGIDTIAMKSALEHGGTVCAVLGNSIDSIYPSNNKQLAAQIITSGGYILSENSPNTITYKFRFPLRNRIISALSNKIAIIDAPNNSGALITAEYGAKQNKPIMFHALNRAYAPNKRIGKLLDGGAQFYEECHEILDEHMGVPRRAQH